MPEALLSSRFTFYVMILSTTRFSHSHYACIHTPSQSICQELLPCPLKSGGMRPYMTHTCVHTCARNLITLTHTRGTHLHRPSFSHSFIFCLCCCLFVCLFVCCFMFVFCFFVISLNNSVHQFRLKMPTRICWRRTHGCKNESIRSRKLRAEPHGQAAPAAADLLVEYVFVFYLHIPLIYTHTRASAHTPVFFTHI